RRKGPQRSNTPGGSTPDSRVKRKMLIVPEPGLLGGLLAEPVIRAIGEGRKGELEITVCHECADLFAGHPSVHALAYSYPDRAGVFDQAVTLLSGPGKGKVMDKIFAYGVQAGAAVQ